MYTAIACFGRESTAAAANTTKEIPTVENTVVATCESCEYKSGVGNFQMNRDYNAKV